MADEIQPPWGDLPLVDAVRAAITRHRLVPPGSGVLVGVSGGPDSVALLDALATLRPELGLSLLVAHVDHGLRPEAERDAVFVRGLAARLDCPVTVARVEVPHRAGRSPEAAARAARYAAFARLAREAGASRIAVGHTADDQAETVLMRLLQGAGPRGLAGIPVRRGAVVRPLLGLERAAVLAHLAARGLAYVEDATNQDVKLLRNRLRHELLPLLRTRWPGIDRVLRRSAGAARELVDALDALLAPRAVALVQPALGAVRLELAPFAGLPVGAVKTLLRLALIDVAGRPEVRAGLRARHVEQLAALVTATPGARVRLPGGLVVERGRGALWLAGRARAPWPAPLALAVPGITPLPGLGGRLVVEAPAAEPRDRADDGVEVWLDAAAVPGALAVRPRRTAERFVPFGGDRPIRVSRVLAAAGTPRLARGAWPLLVARGEAEETVLWVIGVRRAAAAPVTRQTRTALRVRLELEPIGGPREEST